MAHRSPAELIEAYRRRQARRFPFTFGDLSQALLFLLILASTVYISLTGGPEFPTLIELKTNTPTFTPSITPTPSATATPTQTPTNTSKPTETTNPEDQCSCPPPEVLVVTAIFEATHTLPPQPAATEPPTNTALPSSTLPPTETPTSTATLVPTPTQVTYTVQSGDTLGGIALRFGVTVEALQTLNNMDSTMIYVGQVLKIPAP
jgi:LysM repeat protein